MHSLKPPPDTNSSRKPNNHQLLHSPREARPKKGRIREADAGTERKPGGGEGQSRRPLQQLSYPPPRNPPKLEPRRAPTQHSIIVSSFSHDPVRLQFRSTTGHLSNNDCSTTACPGGAIIDHPTSYSSRTPSPNKLAAPGSRSRESTRSSPSLPKQRGAAAQRRTGLSKTTTSAAEIPPKPAGTSFRPSLSNSRTVLQPRDQNAGPLTRSPAPSMSKSVRVTMPYDRSPNPNGAKPQAPHLSAAAARGVSRTPITPKIASKAVGSQVPTLGPAASTPLPKRPLRPNATPNNNIARSHVALHQDDGELPPYLSSNITPRSGTRQGRVDSANSTPNGTPNPDRVADGWDHGVKPVRSRSPAGYDSGLSDVGRRSAVSFNPIVSDVQPRREVQADPDSKFFYASDATRSNPTLQPPQPKSGSVKSPVFFYANGSTIEPETKPPVHSPYTSGSVTHASSQDSLSRKFIYANGTPEAAQSPLSTSSASFVSTNAKLPISRPGTGNSHGIAPRPISPIKLAPGQPQLPHFSQPRTANFTQPVANRGPITSVPQLGPPVGLRRSSTATSRSSHSRNPSLSLGEGDLRVHHIPSGPSSPSLASPGHPPPLTLASIIQAAQDFDDTDSGTDGEGDGEESQVGSPDDSRSELASPTKSTHSSNPVNDLVANARRERKVQDLQITNASLEAINRTLERQLRKQTAELRRYRRLSRAGRFSMASSRMVSDPLTINDNDDETLALSDLSEEGSGIDEEEEDEEDSLSDSDTESLSPSVIAERDAKHRKRDEKRLQLDLSKHQQLLTDSQKINQSIKRCLDWTEELIKEGKKALEYSVRPSDVEIPGPRVLNPVDMEDEPTQTSNFDFDPEESPKIEPSEEKPSMPLEPKLAGWKPESDPVDMDSGISLLSTDGG
ncbi:hypothetical protein BX600DRAFT_515044 [Xylariales sp. PMI_506]|nr:hypothetical protein BX600DRAFT_515044 [Xylariales sp. PMI_506]